MNKSAITGGFIGLAFGLIFTGLIYAFQKNEGHLAYTVLVYPGMKVADVWLWLGLPPNTTGERAFGVYVLSMICFWPIFLLVIGYCSGWLMHRKKFSPEK